MLPVADDRRRVIDGPHGAVLVRGTAAQLGAFLARRHGHRRLQPPGLRAGQRREILRRQRFLFEQQTCPFVEHAALLRQDLLGPRVGLVDERLHRQVDFARRLLGVVFLAHADGLVAEIGLAAALEHRLSKLPGHAEAGHDLARDIGHLGKIVGGAGRDLPEHHVLGGRPDNRTTMRCFSSRRVMR